MLKFEGSTLFRQRIITCTLAGKSLQIDNFRSREEQPGLGEAEASFLRLLEKITNGSVIEINETGTRLRYRPGFLIGGQGLKHDCGTSKGIGWFLEALICLAPFSKEPLGIVLTGITNDDTCQSVDAMRTASLPLLKRFGVGEGLELRIAKRGAPPKGGGEVYFSCPIVKALQPLIMLDPGRVRRVRGIAYSAKVTPQMCNRAVDSAKKLLVEMLPDVYIYTDHYKGPAAGNSPGFGLTLVAETTTGCVLAADKCGAAGILPEEVGDYTSKMLLEMISHGGCVDTSHQSLMLLMMALTPEDVSKIRLGPLSSYTIQFLRLLKTVLGITFKLDADEATKSIVCTCIGIGFTNVARHVQ